MKLFELKDVKTKKHPKEGLFATGSASEIAAWLKSEHDDLKSAMGALNFYVNRAGKNLSDSQKGKMSHAKALLHAKYQAEKDADSEKKEKPKKKEKESVED